MKVTNEINLAEFNAWQGAEDTQETILNEGKEKQFDDLINELYSDGLTATELNDLLWFDSDWVCKQLGIEGE